MHHKFSWPTVEEFTRSNFEKSKIVPKITFYDVGIKWLSLITLIVIDDVPLFKVPGPVVGGGTLPVSSTDQSARPGWSGCWSTTTNYSEDCCLNSGQLRWLCWVQPENTKLLTGQQFWCQQILPGQQVEPRIIWSVRLSVDLKCCDFASASHSSRCR